MDDKAKDPAPAAARRRRLRLLAMARARNADAPDDTTLAEVETSDIDALPEPDDSPLR